MKLRTPRGRALSRVAFSPMARHGLSLGPCVRNGHIEDRPLWPICGPTERRSLRLAMVCAALWLSGVSCSSGQSVDRLTDVLADGEVVAELRYEAVDDDVQFDLSSRQTVLLDVEEFVSALVATDGGVPSWLAVPELTPTDGTMSPDERAEAMEDSLRKFMPTELGEHGRRYVWSLYWALSMPPEAVQLAILESEFTGKDSADWDFDGFRARYPEYLEEVAHAWLDTNRDLRPAGLKIE